MPAENNTGQSEKCNNDSTLLANGSLVLNNDETLQVKTSAIAEKHGETNAASLGPFCETFFNRTTEIITREFIFKLLQSTGLPSDACKHMAKTAYRKSLNKKMGCTIKSWITFTNVKKYSKTDLSTQHIIEFMQNLFFEQNKQYATILSAEDTLCEMKKLKGEKITKLDVIFFKKFLMACFSERPPVPTMKTTWDINILLKHLNSLSPNENLSCNQLARKALLLILLATMCRRGEAAQLKLSRMCALAKGLTFHLDKPTKTYSPRTFHYHRKLQRLFIPELSSDPLLCPVEMLTAYLKRVEPIHGNVDEVFILFRDNASPASNQTLSHWTKNILIKAGITGYTLRSTRSASASGALLTGIPLDRILSQAGWIGNSTFVRNYMRPLSQALDRSCAGQEFESKNYLHLNYPQQQVKTKKGRKIVLTQYAEHVNKGSSEGQYVRKVHKQDKLPEIKDRKIPDGKCPKQKQMLTTDKHGHAIFLTKKGELQVKKTHTPLRKKARLQEASTINTFKKLWQLGKNCSDMSKENKLIQKYKEAKGQTGLFSRSNRHELQKVMHESIPNCRKKQQRKTFTSNLSKTLTLGAPREVPPPVKKIMHRRITHTSVGQQ